MQSLLSSHLATTLIISRILVVDKLEKIQRAAARFVTQNYRQTASVTSLIQNLGWTDLKTRRKNYRLLCMFKILNELVEITINDC